jgi:hypothetical protein
MLAAIPKRTHEMELVKLTLSLVSSRESEIPQALKDFFTTVVTQAKALAANPRTPPESLIPEAIDLALEMVEEEAFWDTITPVSNFDGLTPDVAERLLTFMGGPAAYQS